MMPQTDRRDSMNILVVDDEREIADVIELYLQNDQYSVFKFYTGQDALDCIRDKKIDLAILDVMLPDIDGFQILKKIREKYTFPVIMLTAKDAVASRLEGFQAGADDYLVKPFSFLELLARLQVITKRVRTKEQTNIYIGDLHIDLLARRATRGSRRLELTAKEFSLLEVLAQRQSQIVSKTVITELVWDICFDTNTNVVEATVKRLRAKLEQEGEPKLLHTIRGMGYVLEQR